MSWPRIADAQAVWPPYQPWCPLLAQVLCNRVQAIRGLSGWPPDDPQAPWVHYRSLHALATWMKNRLPPPAVDRATKAAEEPIPYEFDYARRPIMADQAQAMYSNPARRIARLS